MTEYESRSHPGRSVLFVCMGNICRSPTGEGVLRHLAAERGLGEEIVIDSAGTISYHEGERADRRMRRAAAERGYELTSRSRRVTPDDFQRFALILAMDRQNLQDLEDIARGPADLRLLSEFLPTEQPVDVPDPYYGGPGGFGHVVELIEQACPAILDHLLAL